MNTELIQHIAVRRATSHIFRRKPYLCQTISSILNLILSGKINTQATQTRRTDGSCRLQAWEWVSKTDLTRLESPCPVAGLQPYAPDSKLVTPSTVRWDTKFGNSWLYGETWACLQDVYCSLCVETVFPPILYNRQLQRTVAKHVWGPPLRLHLLEHTVFTQHLWHLSVTIDQ